MKQKAFKQVLADLGSFNSRQIRQLEAGLAQLKKQEQTATLLETPFEDVSCPRCGSMEKWRWGKRDQLQRYKCKSCNKTFNCLTGTPLARLNKKQEWLTYANCLKLGYTVRKAAKKCNVHKNTAFHWRHRFLSATTQIKPTQLHGIIETKESYFRKSEKGTRHLNRKPRLRGGQRIELPKSELICLFLAKDRDKNTFDTLMERFTTQSILKTQPIFAKDALLCSESKWIYRNFAKATKLKLGTLNLSKGETEKKVIVHLSNVTSYHNALRSWLQRFHGVATKYLGNYLSWYREMDEFDFSISEEVLIIRAKEGGTYKLLPKIRT
jgi:transposase-like protein